MEERRMKQFKGIFAFLLVWTIFFSGMVIRPPALAAEETENTLYDGYIVKVLDNVPRRMSLFSSGIKDIGHGYFVADSREAAAGFFDENFIEYMEPNYYVTLFDYPADPPNDPYYSSNPSNTFGQ